MAGGLFVYNQREMSPARGCADAIAPKRASAQTFSYTGASRVLEKEVSCSLCLQTPTSIIKLQPTSKGRASRERQFSASRVATGRAAKAQPPMALAHLFNKSKKRAAKILFRNLQNPVLCNNYF